MHTLLSSFAFVRMISFAMTERTQPHYRQRTRIVLVVCLYLSFAATLTTVFWSSNLSSTNSTPNSFCGSTPFGMLHVINDAFSCQRLFSVLRVGVSPIRPANRTIALERVTPTSVSSAVNLPALFCSLISGSSSQDARSKLLVRVIPSSLVVSKTLLTPCMCANCFSFSAMTARFHGDMYNVQSERCQGEKHG